MNKWLLLMLRQALKLASPAILDNLREMVQDMCEKAEKTENPWDDILCDFLQTIVGTPKK